MNLWETQELLVVRVHRLTLQGYLKQWTQIVTAKLLWMSLFIIAQLNKMLDTLSW